VRLVHELRRAARYIVAGRRSGLDRDEVELPFLLKTEDPDAVADLEPVEARGALGSNARERVSAVARRDSHG